MSKVRKPCVAGSFYAGESENLKKQISHVFTDPLGPGEIPQPKLKLKRPVGVVAPHAGYPYSGAVASHSYHFLGNKGKPVTHVLIGTNHSGLGRDVSIATEGHWETPLGKVGIDSEMARRILQKSQFIQESEKAFSREHSLEVQLPFLQFIYDEFKFVPICFRNQGQELSREVGGVLAEIVGDRSIAIIASSDFTHYEPHQIATKKDKQAIKRILNLDIEGFYETVRRDSISICGYGAIAALMETAKKLGLAETNLLKYATSGEVMGIKAEVVGYAAISFA